MIISKVQLADTLLPLALLADTAVRKFSLHDFKIVHNASTRPCLVNTASFPVDELPVGLHRLPLEA